MVRESGVRRGSEDSSSKRMRDDEKRSGMGRKGRVMREEEE